MLSSNRFSLLPLALLTGLVLVSCSESLKSQCSRFGTTVNGYSKQVKDNPPKNFNDLSRIANDLDKYATELEAIKLNDQKLREFQGRFVAMYQQTSAASRKLVAASNKPDPKTGLAALTELQTAVKQEEPLLKDVNEYCQGQ